MQAAEQTRGTRILIAEDESIIRLDLRQQLESLGYDVCAEARDGAEAVALAMTERPDIAVLDVKMPGLDGIEAARQIMDAHPIPILMLTAFDEELLVARAARAGAYGYLVKPYRESDLSPAIVTARARFEELRAARSEVATLAEALESRKMVERAKGLLMERDRLTEEEAYTRLRRASQSSGKKIGAVAEMVVLALSGTAKKG